MWAQFCALDRHRRRRRQQPCRSYANRSEAHHTLSTSINTTSTHSLWHPTQQPQLTCPKEEANQNKRHTEWIMSKHSLKVHTVHYSNSYFTIMHSNCFLLEYIWNVILFLGWQSWIFSSHYCVISVTCYFRNHSNTLIWCLSNISYYYECWKQLCCFICLWKPWYTTIQKLGVNIFFKEKLILY